MDKLRALKYFVEVVETKSFTKAAKLFSVPPSSLSRRIADLEQSLGATLLVRSTRVVKLSEIGQSYYQQAKQIIALIEQSDESVKSYQSSPMGMLNISSMVGYGERILLPLLDEFSQKYPDIILNVTLSDELSTLGKDDVDLAIRGGYAPDERVIAIKLMDNNFIPVAANSYLQKYGTPCSPLDLAAHKGLYFKTPNGPTPWIAEIAGKWQDVSSPDALISNNGKWLVDKAIEGGGILMMPRWVLQPYIDSGELSELKLSPAINITQNSNLGVFLLYQRHRYQVPKVKVAVDFLIAKMKEY